jgi:hypothetical protein
VYVRKGVPDHAVKAYRGTRGVAPLILKLGARWKWVFTIAPLPLYPREKIRPVPIEEEAGWSGVFGEQRNLLSMPGFELQIAQSVA